MKANISISLDVEDAIELLTFLKGKNDLKVKMGKSEQKDEASGQKVVVKYEPDTTGLVDILCSKKKVLRTVFIVLSKMTNKAVLYFNSSGMISRFITSDNKIMIDIRISRELFEVYHVREHARMILLPKFVHQVIRPTEKGLFHLLASKSENRVLAGEWGFEHTITSEGLMQSDYPSPVESELPEPKAEAEATLPFELFRGIMNNARFWRPNFLTFEKDKLTFSAGPDEHNFVKVMTPENDNIEVSIQEGISCSFDGRELHPLLDARFSIASRIRITKQGSALCFEPLVSNVALRYYLPIMIEMNDGLHVQAVPSKS